MLRKIVASKLLVLLLLGLAGPARGAGGIKLTLVGSYQSGSYDEGAAESVAYDPAGRQLFVLNNDEVAIDLIDISDPASPSLTGSIDLSEYGPAATSLAFKEGIVAVAVEGDPKQVPGRVLLLDTAGSLLKVFTVGALPDMVTFTPDGQTILVANEGEPSEDYSLDPEGSISIIDISGGVERAVVTTATFVDFNAQADRLRAAGVRIYGPGATLAQDVEPEYIAVAPDGRTAWVSLQENNAVARLDIAAGRISEVVPLGSKNHGASLEIFPIFNLPLLGATAAGQDILLGGFSGLFFEGINPANGNLIFVTHPDRGPVAGSVDTNGDGLEERPFVLPDLQAEIVRFELDRSAGTVEITDRIKLFRADGRPISGRPNLAGEPGLAYADEIPIDLRGRPLERDPFGADPEGIVRAEDGSYWLVDEYRPAIYHFEANGWLIERFVPLGSSRTVDTGSEALPAVYAQRQVNRGFEAVAYDRGKLYAFLQGPLDNPDVDDDDNAEDSIGIRILEFDTVSKTTTGQYYYLLEGDGSDKIGDAVALGQGQFLVLERDADVGPGAKKKLFRVSLAGATNLNDLEGAIVGPGGSLEGLGREELAEAGIEPVRKAMYADLIALGYDFSDKPEGLALVDQDTVAVINDNDFQLDGDFELSTGLLAPNANPLVPVLGLISLQNPLDVSDRDGLINITSWPVAGLYQPDGLATFSVGGQTYLISANEGESRDYEEFSEEVRVADLGLDPVAYPQAEALQAETALGRLQATELSGDRDGDGDIDQIHAFGGRSFSIWDSDLNLLYDSGAQFERIVAETLPDYFNDGGDSGFDARSDARGPEPEGVITAVIGGQTYAFVALERMGGVMVYEVSDPTAPIFVQYVNNRNFGGDPEAGTAGDIAPEGLLFITGTDSPSGRPLLVVANEVSGSTTIYEIRAEGPGGQQQRGRVQIENRSGTILTVTLNRRAYYILNNTERALSLAPGRYSYTASVPGGQTMQGEVMVTAGETTELTIDLSREGGLSGEKKR